MTPRSLAYLVTAICLNVSVSIATAAIIVVSGDTGDGQVDVNGVPVDLPDPTIRPGTGGDIVRGQASVFLFQLPNIGVGSVVTKGNLQLSFLGFDGSPEFNLDLFGLGVRSSATIVSSDYYAGNSSGGSGTLIQTMLLIPSASIGTVNVAPSNQVSLGSYLESLYSPSGVPADQFLALRLNPDIPLPSNSGPMRGYLLATADNSNSGLRPELQLTTVAEPSSGILGSLVGLIFLASRLAIRLRRSP